MPPLLEKPKLLCIGGHDVNMGAGLEMDYSVGEALGCNVHLCPTMYTNQSKKGLQSVDCIDKKSFEEDLRHKLSQDIKAIKIGALGNEHLLGSLIKALDEFDNKFSIIFDPVYSASISAPGVYLNTAHGIRLAEQELLRRVSLATPNALEYGDGLAYKKCAAVLLKGGHCSDALEYISDTLYVSGEKLLEVRHALYQGVGLIHGTGCALSTAIAAFVAQSFNLERSVICALSIMDNWIFEALKRDKALTPYSVEIDKKLLEFDSKKIPDAYLWI